MQDVLWREEQNNRMDFNLEFILILFLSVWKGIIEDTCRDLATYSILLCGHFYKRSEAIVNFRFYTTSRGRVILRDILLHCLAENIKRFV